MRTVPPAPAARNAPSETSPFGPELSATTPEAAIRRAAHSLGFAACGITGAEDLGCGPLLEAWLEEGRHGDMEYLAEKHARRLQPSAVFAGARSVVVVAWPTVTPQRASDDWQRLLRGRVAAYTLGADYHTHVADKLSRLAAIIRERTGADSVVHVDGGPLVEKELARRAGIGWYGRHTNLLRPGLGSTFVLGCIVTAAPLAPDPPFASDHCGTCRACVPACPTGALDTPPTIDARLCISYLTIEHRGPIPRELRARVGNWVFGCDLCQEACPWNDAPSPPHPLLDPWLPGWLAMTEDEFRESFAATSLRRPKRRGLARNAAVALGNSANPEAVPFLATALGTHDEPLVRAHAAWALGQLGGGESRSALRSRLCREPVPPVRRELEAAILRAADAPERDRADEGPA